MRTILVALVLVVFGAAAAHAQLDLPARAWEPAPGGTAQGHISLAARPATPPPPTGGPVEILSQRRQREASLGRHVAWGAAIGAAGGVLSSVFVISQCEETCDEDRAANVALHIGIGVAAGAAAGAILYHLRR